MIDFRYHLVSIVAVFIALAVGIVVGATALQGEVAGALKGQVTELRDDKQGLRGELDASREGSRRQDQYIDDSAPRALRRQLAGRTVAVVVLPDTPAGLIRDTRARLRFGGAKVTAITELSADWISGPAAERQATLAKAAKQQKANVSSVQDNRVGGLVLAEALTVKPGSGAGAVERQPGLNTLRDADLLQVEPESPERAESIVVLWPGAEKSEPGWINLVTALGLAGRPAVGVSSGPVTATAVDPDAMVSTLRDSAEVTGAMSTVDHGERPIGQAATVLALRDEFAGRSGHYGLDEDAAAVAPKVEEPPEDSTP